MTISYLSLYPLQKMLNDGDYESYEKCILQNEFLEFLQDMPEIKKYNQNKNEK